MKSMVIIGRSMEKRKIHSLWAISQLKLRTLNDEQNKLKDKFKSRNIVMLKTPDKSGLLKSTDNRKVHHAPYKQKKEEKPKAKELPPVTKEKISMKENVKATKILNSKAKTKKKSEVKKSPVKNIEKIIVEIPEEKTEPPDDDTLSDLSSTYKSDDTTITEPDVPSTEPDFHLPDLKDEPLQRFDISTSPREDKSDIDTMTTSTNNDLEEDKSSKKKVNFPLGKNKKSFPVLPKVPENVTTETEKHKKRKKVKNAYKLPKVKSVVIPKELMIREKTISATEKIERKFSVSTPIVRNRCPSYKEFDLGMVQPIYKLQLEQDSDNLENTSMDTYEEDVDLSFHNYSFSMEHSLDCVEWSKYTDSTGNHPSHNLIFEEQHGNLSCTLEDEIDARYIRIHPGEGVKIKDSFLKVEPQDLDRESPQRRKIRELMFKDRLAAQSEPMESLVTSLKDFLYRDPPVTPNSDGSISSVSGEMFQDDLLVNVTVEEYPERDYLSNSKSKTAMFLPSVDTSQTSIDESAAFRKHQKLLLNRKRAAKMKVDAMLNSTHYVRKSDDEPSTGDVVEDESDDSMDSEDDFFRKYCIITKEQKEWFEFLFKMYQEGKNEPDDSLSLSDALDAMNVANRSLVSEGKIHYILTAMSILGVAVEGRINLRTFMLMIAFSEKVLSLGDFFQLTVDKIDYPYLLNCLIKAKQMYQILLRDGERTIYIEDFVIEMQAANVKLGNAVHVITKDKEKRKLDFLDYLTYFPLFVYTHKIITMSPV